MQRPWNRRHPYSGLPATQFFFVSNSGVSATTASVSGYPGSPVSLIVLVRLCDHTHPFGMLDELPLPTCPAPATRLDRSRFRFLEHERCEAPYHDAEGANVRSQDMQHRIIKGIWISESLLPGNALEG
jgi:hypothetical protein